MIYDSFNFSPVLNNRFNKHDYNFDATPGLLKIRVF